MEYIPNPSQSLTPFNERDFEFRRSLPPNALILPGEEDFADLHTPTVAYETTTPVAGVDMHVTIEVPDEILSHRILMVSNAFCAPEIAYKKFREAAARNGSIVATYDPIRKYRVPIGHNLRYIRDPRILLEDSLHAGMEAAHGYATKELGLRLPPEFDVTAQSMGGPTGTGLALRHPELFRSLILNKTPGLEKHNIVTMLGRLPKFSQELRGVDADVILGGLGYIALNPGKTLLEGIAVAQHNIRERVQALRAHNIGTGIVIAQNDRLINARGVVRDSGMEVADVFAVHTDEHADHLLFQKYPFLAAMSQKVILQTMHGTTDEPELQAA